MMTVKLQIVVGLAILFILAILINMILPQKSGTEICVGLDAGSDSIVCI